MTDDLPIGMATARRVRGSGPKRIKTIAPAPIPDEVSADDLLDLADDHWHCDRIAEAVAVAAEFDDRHARAELTALQRARRADLNGLVSANDNDLEVAEISWSSAIDLYAEAGDELRRQMARCRVAVLMCRTGRTEIGLPIAEDATGHLAVHAPKHHADGGASPDGAGLHVLRSRRRCLASPWTRPAGSSITTRTSWPTRS